MNTLTNWDALSFFQDLTAKNLLAQEKGFVCCSVSGATDFQEVLGRMQTKSAFICVDDISDGFVELNNSPRTRRVKSVFMAMRYPIDDLRWRAVQMETMRELFRQFMTKLTLEQTKLEQNRLYLDPRIRFTEIPEYFAAGCACARFEIAVDTFTDLRYNAAEWLA